MPAQDVSETDFVPFRNAKAAAIVKMSANPLKRSWRESRNGDEEQLSQSYQVLLELGEQATKRVRSLYRRLDQESLEREAEHLRDLSAAADEHNRVRRAAQRAQERLELEADRERRRREDEEQRALDRERQQEVENEIAARRRAIDEARQLEERKRVAEQARAQAEQEQQEREQRQREEEEETRRVEAERREHERREQESKKLSADTARDTSNKQTNGTLAPDRDSASSKESRLADHERYLDLHKRLKEFRKSLLEELKQNKALKSKVGDWRRDIRKRVGQLTSNKSSWQSATRSIRDTIVSAAQSSPSTVDVRQYIVQPLPSSADATNNAVPSLLVYLLNVFAKAIVGQLINEAGADPKTADPTGILAITIFSRPELQWQGVAFVDLLLTKYHKVCPPLFGIYGSEDTEKGRAALGWWRDPDTGTWITQQRHTERMTGLGAGWAALTLRDFSSSSSRNPLPATYFWSSVAQILNVPPAEITQTHCILLKSMIENHVQKFIAKFGQAAIVVLRKAVVDYAQQAPSSAVSQALATLATTIKRDDHVSL